MANRRVNERAVPHKPGWRVMGYKRSGQRGKANQAWAQRGLRRLTVKAS